jgi:hypothetical protein
MTKQDFFRRELQCVLSPAELDIYRDELARLTTEEMEIEGAKKEAVSEFGAKLQKCVAARRLLATKISTKKEYRQVEVKWEKHFEQNCATLIRQDTLEVVDTRPLTAEERQQELDLQAPEPATDERQESVAEELETIQETVSTDDEPQPEPDADNLCNVSDCPNYNADENNNCSRLEYTEECDVLNPPTATEPEFAGEETAESAFECKGCKKRKVKRICEVCTA